MKTYSKGKFIMVLSFGILMMNACTDRFEEINTPSNLLVSENVNVDMLFTSVISSIANMNNDNGLGTIGNYSGMSVSGANRPFLDGESTGNWNSTYSDYARNLSDSIDLCQGNENAANLINKIAVARIMKAWSFARCTDIYGDIPYSESCLPISQAVYKPQYDEQKNIYTDLFKELKEAASQLDESKPTFEEADILYQGDVVKWRKFANSLRLRLAIRVRYADPALSASQMSDLEEADLITDAADDALVYTIADYPNHMNSFYVDLVERGDIVQKNSVPKTFLDILIGGGDAHNPEDPRTKVYADTSMADWPGRPGFENVQPFGYRGIPLLGNCPVQQKNPYGAESVSRWSDLIWVQKIARPLFQASETYFILAEAALTGIKGSKADAQGYYHKGLQLAMAQSKLFYENSLPQLPEVRKLFKPDESEAQILEYIASKAITQIEIDDFLTSSPITTLNGTDEEQLEQIINQKMIALFPQEHEAWAEYRRTGYPRVLVGDDADDLKGKMPRRMAWPDNEQTINGKEFSIAVEKIGGINTRSARFWWDANPNPIHPHREQVEWMEKGWLE